MNWVRRWYAVGFEAGTPMMAVPAPRAELMDHASSHLLHLSMVLLSQFEPLDSAARYQGGGIPKGFVIVTVLVLLYALPTMLAWRNKSRRRWKITAINLALGWTVIGWIVSMVLVFAYEAPPDGEAPDQPHQPRYS